MNVEDLSRNDIERIVEVVLNEFAIIAEEYEADAEAQTPFTVVDGECEF